jgi:small subunit ribosomal protein S16
VVKIRLMRVGRLHQGSFRIVAADEQAQRDGNTLEMLGSYNPRAKDATKQVAIKADRVVYWISQGAQPTATVDRILRKSGIKATEVRAQLRAARAEAAKN